jgi:anti-anti-sigma factor
MATAFAPVLVESLGKLTFVHVLGELDISNCMEFSAALDAAAMRSPGPIIIAFVECSYVDTSGLTALVSGHRKYGKRIHVVVPPESSVRKIFQTTGLHRALLVHGDFRTAIADASVQLEPVMA